MRRQGREHLAQVMGALQRSKAKMGVFLYQSSSMHKYPTKCAEEQSIAEWRMHSASCSGPRTVEEGLQQYDAGIACTVDPKMRSDKEIIK